MLQNQFYNRTFDQNLINDKSPFTRFVNCYKNKCFKERYKTSRWNTYIIVWFSSCQSYFNDFHMLSSSKENRRQETFHPRSQSKCYFNILCQSSLVNCPLILLSTSSQFLFLHNLSVSMFVALSQNRIGIFGINVPHILCSRDVWSYLLYF